MLVSVILSGGLGTRLWPLSDAENPKPFIKLNDGRSLLYKTYERAIRLDGLRYVCTVTNLAYYLKSKGEISALRTDGVEFSFILEPFGKNTLSSVSLAALDMHRKFGGDCILLVMPADQLISDQDSFQKSVTKAVKIAKDGFIVTFGLIPTRPETGFGYIKAGERVDEDGFKVESFVEKPNLETVKKYLESGDYLWNSGMFCFEVGLFLKELSVHHSDLLSKLEDCLVFGYEEDSCALEIQPKFMDVLPQDSVDSGLIQRSGRVAVVPADFPWSDVGTWRSFSKIYSADENGNRIDGKAILIDVNNCLIKGDRKVIAALGISDLIIVDSRDALLISHKDRDQDVKNIINHLREDGSEI